MASPPLLSLKEKSPRLHTSMQRHICTPTSAYPRWMNGAETDLPPPPHPSSLNGYRREAKSRLGVAGRIMRHRCGWHKNWVSRKSTGVSTLSQIPLRRSRRRALKARTLTHARLKTAPTVPVRRSRRRALKARTLTHARLKTAPTVAPVGAL